MVTKKQREGLTIEDIDTYTKDLSRGLCMKMYFQLLIQHLYRAVLNVTSISVIGEIHELSKERNSYTGREYIYYESWNVMMLNLRWG